MIYKICWPSIKTSKNVKTTFSYIKIRKDGILKASQYEQKNKVRPELKIFVLEGANIQHLNSILTFNLKKEEINPSDHRR